jgi:hypothetical protein
MAEKKDTRQPRTTEGSGEVADPATIPMPGPQADVVEAGGPVVVENPRGATNSGHNRDVPKPARRQRGEGA